MESEYIAIVGAGLAGAVLAQRFTAAGHQVTVFEKSRGSGGRLASCRINATSLDLGAPWFEPQSTAFKDWLLQQPDMVEWQPNAVDFDGSPIELPVVLNQTRQSSLTRQLLQRAEFRTQTRISRISPSSGHGVGLWDDKQLTLGGFDKAIITAPAPQALPLLPQEPDLTACLQTIGTRPCWVAIVRTTQHSLPDVTVMQGQHPIFARLICLNNRPGDSADSDQTLWRLEANADWSSIHAESPAAEVEALMLTALSKIEGFQGPAEVHRVHRWLYCTHTQPHQDAYYYNATSGIGACGDWFGNLGSESAWYSASCLADSLLDNEFNEPAV
ncbi:NAD(P)/FAD-dependent oxidoreductase [Pontibacter sp. JAM-7]|uniref:NAD(P)/FAD-dependent oxidoreductase n=1 Tax=Pontibacter sp. JAM-7 TaxID=3366581 RepID=UPI003AF5047E